MGGLSIDTGEVSLAVNGDESRVVRFNPEDVGFAERFYRLMGDYGSRREQYARRAEQCAGDAAAAIELVSEICADMRQRIDGVFGEGTSDAAFGDAMSPRMLTQFFEGVAPYIARAREVKLEKYRQGPHSRQ